MNDAAFKKLFGDSFWLILIRVGGMLCSMLLMLVLARIISPEQLGYYSLGMSTALLAGLAFSFNLSASAVRFINEYRGKDQWARLREYCQFGRRMVSVGACISLLLALALYFLPGMLFDDVAIHPGVVIALIAAPALALMRVEAANVHALGYILRSSLPNMLLRPVLLLGAVALCWALGVEIHAVFVMLLFLATVCLVTVLQYVIYRPALADLRTANSADSLDTAGSSKGEWLQVSAQLLVPVLFLEFTIDTMIVLAALVLPPADVAVLSIALRLQSIVLFGVTSVNMAVGPKIAQAYNDKEFDKVRSLLSMSAHLKLWPSLLLLLILYLFGGWVLGLFGPHYAAYKDILLILCLSPLVLAIYGPTVLFMTLLGLQQRGSILFLGSIIGLVLSVVVAGHLFGLHGVAWSLVLVWCIWNHVLSRWVLKESGINTTVFAAAAPQRAANS